MKRQFKNFAKSTMAIGHRTALRAGIVVLPNHYYTPVADTHELRRTRSSWARRSPMIGIDVDVRDQSAALRSMVKPFEPEFQATACFGT